jgi:hypothetical protein
VRGGELLLPRLARVFFEHLVIELPHGLCLEEVSQPECRVSDVALSRDPQPLLRLRMLTHGVVNS